MECEDLLQNITELIQSQLQIFQAILSQLQQNCQTELLTSIPIIWPTKSHCY